jgi:hypothetical protein
MVFDCVAGDVPFTQETRKVVSAMRFPVEYPPDVIPTFEANNAPLRYKSHCVAEGALQESDDGVL